MCNLCTPRMTYWLTLDRCINRHIDRHSANISTGICQSTYWLSVKKSITPFFHRALQLLDKISVISRIIKVKVGVISQIQRLRLITCYWDLDYSWYMTCITNTDITLFFTSKILDNIITKPKFNNCFIIHWKNGSHFFIFFTDGKR